MLVAGRYDQPCRSSSRSHSVPLDTHAINWSISTCTRFSFSAGYTAVAQFTIPTTLSLFTNMFLVARSLYVNISPIYDPSYTTVYFSNTSATSGYTLDCFASQRRNNSRKIPSLPSSPESRRSPNTTLNNLVPDTTCRLYIST